MFWCETSFTLTETRLNKKKKQLQVHKETEKLDLKNIAEQLIAVNKERKRFFFMCFIKNNVAHHNILIMKLMVFIV